MDTPMTFHMWLVVAVTFILGVEFYHLISVIWKLKVRKNVLRYRQNLFRYTEARYSKIPKDQFVMGKGIWNNDCHKNAVQALKDGIAEKIIMCMCFAQTDIFVHYINVDNDGKYVDNTFGWEYMRYDYYFIREIQPDEYPSLPYYITSMNDKNINHHSKWPFRKAVRKATSV